MSRKEVENVNGIDNNYVRVKEFARLYKLGINKAYRLCKDPSFPKVKVGKVILVDCKGFENWLDDKKKRNLEKLF